MYERSPILMERKFNEYLLPTVLISVALSMATVIDSVIVGNLLGETALSAVGLASPVIYGLNALFLLFAVGGVACASIAKGRREDQNANRIFTLTFGVGSAALLALTAALLAFIGPISLALAQGDAELARLTQAFLTPAVFIGPFMLLTMGLAQFVRADGRPRLAAWVAIAANAVKLVLTYVFIRFLDTGISGAALSTVLGYAAGFLLLLPYFFSKERGFKLVKIGKGDFGRLTGMLRVGLPEALTQGLSFLRALVLNLLIVSLLGALGMTVMTLCINALMIASIVIFGTNDTLLPIVGTLYGEKDWSGIRFTMRAALRFLMIAGVAIALIFLLIPGAVGRLLGITSAEGLALAVPALRLFAL
ncbi:MAG: MATE family efflux transporter, partial [Clostridiales bacterium]|nr:MATE family efflux transporter [Clostridiales bacterium]